LVRTSMANLAPKTAFRAFLYGGAALLLAFDLFFLVKALFTGNFVPIVPIVAGVFTAIGLLFVVYAETNARERDKREHRRISRVAHQLENPLNALQTDLTQLIKDADKLPSEARLKLKHMETKASVLLENVRDVFLTLQVQQHPVATEVRTYDLCAIVRDVIENLRDLAQARNVELLSKLHCETAPVKVDRQLMMIVLTHLIENAILYTMKPGLVNVVITRGDKRTRVIVQDRGIGITDQDAAIIFQPFARGPRAAEYDPDGIGVGLTLSRLIVKEFGGQLTFQSKERGMGTEFEVSLPLA